MVLGQELLERNIDSYVYLTMSRFWGSTTTEDITLDIIEETPTENISEPHRLSLTLSNRNYKYTDPTSYYYINKGSKLLYKLGNRYFKFLVREEPENINDETVTFDCVSISAELFKTYVQIRPGPSSLGYYTVENTLWASLYDSGWHNFFRVKLPDGNYYSTASDNAGSTYVDATILIYDTVSIGDILNDLCARTGCTWYENPGTDTVLSDIEIIPMIDEFEATIDNTLIIDSLHDIENDIEIKIDYESIINLIILRGGIVRTLSDAESIRRYGYRSSKLIEVPDDADIETVLSYAHTYLQVGKDPDINITLKVSGIPNISTANYYIHINKNLSKHLRSLQDGYKYRLRTLQYNIREQSTVMEIGTIQRSYLLSDIDNRINASMENSNEDKTMTINKAENITIQMHTEFDYLVGPVASSGSGARVDIDYIINPGDDYTMKIWMDDDGVRNGA